MTAHPEVFQRALRAAAAVTGVVKRGAVIGIASGALAFSCGGSAKPAPKSVDNAGTMTSAADAGAPRDCEDDPGYGSPCCTAEREAGRSPMACTPWGPPAPPVYAGETILQLAA